MAFYVVTGKLGAGKSLVAVGKIREYLEQGRRVATNLDLYLEHLVSDQNTATPIRLPDKPRAQDLDALGMGDGKDINQYDEQTFGLIVLDECASWLNSRQWNDKERTGLIEWMLHARKRHWDVMLLIQDPESLDKQMRQAFCEHLVVCRRLDRFSIPIVTQLSKILIREEIRLPKVHIARVYYGINEQAALADRWVYKGKQLYAGYRTGQVFTNEVMYTPDGELVDMRAPYSLLSAWHLKGRYEDHPTMLQRIYRLADRCYRFLLLRAIHAWAASQGRSPWDVAQEWGVLKREYMQPVPLGRVRPGVLPGDAAAAVEGAGGGHE